MSVRPDTNIEYARLNFQEFKNPGSVVFDHYGDGSYVESFKEYFGHSAVSQGYVNAYTIHSGYGGPEEGGWWYEEGHAYASIPVTTIEEVEAAFERLHHQVERPNEEKIVFETGYATDYPKERPYYE